MAATQRPPNTGQHLTGTFLIYLLSKWECKNLLSYSLIILFNYLEN